MNAHIRYAKTSDGVNVAYATAGQGPPFVWVTDMPFSHLEFEFKHGLVVNQAAWETFLTRRTLVRFDPRGMGLSDRDVKEFSIDSWVLDIEAVAEHLGLDKFSMLGTTNGSPVALAYAAKHPEQVTDLVLSAAGTRPADGFRTPRAQLMGQMLAFDFEMFSENAGAIAFGWGDPRARTFAEFVRAAVTPDTARRVFAALSRVDVSDLLPSIRARTLVIQHPELQYVTRQMSIELASQIPEARLVMVPMSPDTATPAAILEFLEGSTPALTLPAEPGPAGTAIILFADIVDSTALTERLGDAAFREKASALDAAMRSAVQASGGTAIEGKTLGDGVLAVFSAAREAISCAQACHAAAADVGLQLHAGIHAGDVIRETDNVYGGAVNIAARVAGESAAGETLVSQTVRDLARTSADVSFEDRGERALKGIAEPLRLYAVLY